MVYAALNTDIEIDVIAAVVVELLKGNHSGGVGQSQSYSRGARAPYQKYVFYIETRVDS